MRTLNETLSELLAHAQIAQSSLGTEVLPLSDALNRVLASDLLSPIDVPSYDNSQVDGYAGVAVEMNNALTPLAVSQRIAAGHPGGRLKAETVARIFTGAPIPEGVNAVVAQEDVAIAPDGAIKLKTPVSPGQNIRKRGGDIGANDVICLKGRRLTPADLGLCASIGLSSVSVYQPLRVAVFSSGDELRQPGEALSSGQIYDSNRPMVCAFLSQMGLRPTDMGCLADDLEFTKAQLKKAASAHDVILTCGGVSVGEEDHIKSAVSALGALHLWKISVKPGKPFAFGSIKDATFLGMPGNPVAAWVTFLLLVRPFLLARSGASPVTAESFMVKAGFHWPAPDQRQEFLRGWLDEYGAAQIHDRQSSAVLSSVSQSSGLVEIPPATAISAGQMVRYIPFSTLTS